MIGEGTQGTDNHGTDGDIRHKMAVHDVDVNMFGSGAHRFFYLDAQLGEIGGKDGGGKLGAEGLGVYLSHQMSTDINRLRRLRVSGKSSYEVPKTSASIDNILYEE